MAEAQTHEPFFTFSCPEIGARFEVEWPGLEQVHIWAPCVTLTSFTKSWPLTQVKFCYTDLLMRGL